MSTDDERSALSRREMLKRSAAVGGTALWVTPTVAVVSAFDPPGSEAPGGDGSPLRAEWYILRIQCGNDPDTSHFQVKIDQDTSGNEPFIVNCSPDVDEAELRRLEATGQPAGQSGASGCPDDVAFFTANGNLIVDLDADNDGVACEILSWVAHCGRSYASNNPGTGQYGPIPVDDDDPTVVSFLAPCSD